MEKLALVTGSSRGIGAAIATALARSGYGVCINYIEQRERALALAHQLEAEGHRVMCYQADVADAAQVKAMVSAIEAELGHVSVLVNNAGIAEQQQFQDIAQSTWQRIQSVNLGGNFNVTQAVLPHMLHEHSGCIINISSIWGSHGASCESAYSSSKHAIIGLTRSLAAELASSGIRVNCIAPGVIATEMINALGEQTLELLEKEIPLGRFGRPEEIADAAMYLVGAEYMTGQILTLDGGFTS